MADEQIEELGNLIARSHRIVFFSGAGVSTESGIPDFRGSHGLYSQKFHRTLDPERIISHSFLEEDPDTFFEFYKTRLIYPDARPNAAHITAAALERAGMLAGVVTQNIDGLDRMAGTTRVAELHGTTLRNYCRDCGRTYSREYILASPGIPRCDTCGGMVRPDVVLYEEGLDEKVIRQAVTWISEADLLIVAGTSLRVYPAAGLLGYFDGAHMVLINLDATSADHAAELVIRRPVAEVMGELHIPSE